MEKNMQTLQKETEEKFVFALKSRCLEQFILEIILRMMQIAKLCLSMTWHDV